MHGVPIENEPGYLTDDLVRLRLAAWSADYELVGPLEQVNSEFMLEREKEENEGD